MNNSILLSDLHLTKDKNDEYRWLWLDDFTDYLKKSKKPNLFILGDLTEQKDSHRETLVTRLCEYIIKWSAMSDSLIIISGNHDGLVSNKPFFSFLQMLPNVAFITEINEIETDSKILFLPHTRNPIEDWADYKKNEFKNYDYIFMHQTVNKAITSSGFEMSASLLPADYFSKTKAKVYSGDIHVPQEFNNITYVGAPYPIYFGDDYKGRFLHFHGGSKVESIHQPSISKWKLKIDRIDSIKDFKIKEGDQVVIEYTMDRSEQHEWVTKRNIIREKIKECKAMLCSLTLVIHKQEGSISSKATKIKANTKLSPTELLKIYCSRNKLGKVSEDMAIEIMKEVDAR
jgi:UDP-2,3-diacylglucosamine pyrophosphatase LpxH